MYASAGAKFFFLLEKKSVCLRVRGLTLKHTLFSNK